MRPAATRNTDQVTAERLPPQDLDAEMSLLGAMLLSREAIELVLPIISANEHERFYRSEHQELFKILVGLYDQGKPIDLVIVRDELTRHGLLEAVGGEAYLIDLAQSVASWVNAEHYARIVRDKGMLRDLIRCAGQISADAYGQGDDAKTIFDRAEQAMFQVTEQRISNQSLSLRDTLNEVYRMIETHGGHYVSGLSTGFIELDELTCGLQDGELIIMAARPSMGKTALGLNLAERMAADEKISCAFFSMEMSRQQVAQRVLCSRGRVDAHKLRRGMLSEDEIAELGYICDSLKDTPLYIDDTPGMSIMEMRAKVRRLRMRQKVQCVFVDYLQLMHAPGTENRQQEIATISRGLKSLARELTIPVVAMAQLNRSTEIREGHRPRMSDLRESGAIEQDADVVMLLHREEYYKPEDPSVAGQAEIIVAKQRNGPTGTVKLHFNKRLTRFDNLSVAPEPHRMSQVMADPPAPF